MTNFIIQIDTNEQLPYTFQNIKPKPKTKNKWMKTGDYSVLGFDDKICLERKTLQDLFMSVGKGRERFQREFVRMQSFEYSALVIEANLDDIFLNPPEFSSMNKRAVFRTLISWSIRYNVHVWACPDRQFAERLVFILLKRWYELKNMEI